mmetsp:Transcript_29266/g.69510  ORF Transcript_29266/g.69510 Transcript_29266/m.69510 type:complete len:224 (+) Transcript_29266:627-1298(+)
MSCTRAHCPRTEPPAAAPGWVPMSPLAVLKRLTGEEPSVMSTDLSPRPCSSLACISGPACAMAWMVSAPMAATWFLNRSVSMSAICFAICTCSSFTAFWCEISASCCSLSCWSSHWSWIFLACTRSSACFNSASYSICEASALARASAFACPIDWTALDSAWSWRRDCFSFSAATWSLSRWRSSLPCASCACRSASCRAFASWDLVVISIACCTEYDRASRVR